MAGRAGLRLSDNRDAIIPRIASHYPKLPPTSGAMPSALTDESVWPEGRRIWIVGNLPDQGKVEGRFDQVSASDHTSRSESQFASLVSEAQRLAIREGAPKFCEWHLTKIIVDSDPRISRLLGIDPQAF